MIRRNVVVAAGCLIVLVGVAGCGQRDTGKPTAQDVANFRGHQPTADQMQQAMNRATQGAKTAPATPK